MSGVGPVRGNGYAAILRQAAAKRAQATTTTSQTTKVGQPRGLAKLNVADPASFSMDARSVGAPVVPASSGVDRVFSTVNDAQASADKMVIDLASGQDVNIHNTMVELEKADIALKYTVQLRNRALSAYEELMRMQV